MTDKSRLILGRYVLAGGLSYAIELVFIYLLLFIGLTSVLSVGVAFWIGFLAAFFIQKTFTFRDSNSSKGKTAIQMVQYGALVCFNYLFTLLLVLYHDAIGGLFYSIIGTLPLVSSIENFNLLSTRTIALVITTVWNFILYKKVIFRQKK